MNTRWGAWQKLIETYDGQAIKALKKDPLKDIAFIKKLGEGKVKGLSKEALQAMKGAKTMKDAIARAKNAGVEDEIRKAYSKTK